MASDHHSSQSTEAEKEGSKPETTTFRIRFTISNKRTTQQQGNHCNDPLCDHDASACQFCLRNGCGASKTNQICKQPVKFQLIEPHNHKSSLFVSLSDSSRDLCTPSPCSREQGSSTISGQHQDNPLVALPSKGRRSRRHLFVSPELDKYRSQPESDEPSTGPSSPADHSSGSLAPPHAELDICPSPDSNFATLEVDEIEQVSNMSQGCNFINSLMQAKRRSSSATPPTGGSKSCLQGTSSSLSEEDVGPNSGGHHHHHNHRGRRATSSNDLPAAAKVGHQQTGAADRSPQAYVHQSSALNETLTANNVNASQDYHYPGDWVSPESRFQPLEVDVNHVAQPVNGLQQDSEPSAQSARLDFISNNGGCFMRTSLEDSSGSGTRSTAPRLSVDVEKLESDCKDLEEQIAQWELRVDELERQRCRENAPRTLIENVLKQRKLLRDLEFQIFMLNLDQTNHWSTAQLGSPTLDCDILHPQKQPADIERSDECPKLTISGIINRDNLEKPNGLTPATKHGHTPIEPGQEDTAQILNAVPPTGSMQYRQYLNKKTTPATAAAPNQI